MDAIEYTLWCLSTNSMTFLWFYWFSLWWAKFLGSLIQKLLIAVFTSFVHKVSKFYVKLCFSLIPKMHCSLNDSNFIVVSKKLFCFSLPLSLNHLWYYHEVFIWVTIHWRIWMKNDQCHPFWQKVSVYFRLKEKLWFYYYSVICEFLTTNTLYKFIEIMNKLVGLRKSKYIFSVFR